MTLFFGHKRQLVNEPPLFAGESAEVAEVLRKIVCNAGGLLNVCSCSAILLDTATTTFVTLATFQKNRQGRATHFCLSESVITWVAEHRKPFVINDVHLDARFEHQGGGSAGSILCVPLIDDGRFLGTLIARCEEIGAFGVKEIRMLTIFADQAVLAIASTNNAVLALHEVTRMRARFFSMITHELRSPINAINGYLDLALTGIAGELNEQQCEFIRRARAGSEHLYGLIEDILLISRADSGQLRLSCDILNLHEVVKNAVEEMELTAIDRGITIEIDIAKDFPYLSADAVRLQQVLRNLLSNALYFTAAGGCVTVAAYRENNPCHEASSGLRQMAKLMVSDTGCGIPIDFQERVFERFYQVPNAGGGRSGGQGLGLAVVKIIVELHGGWVKVDSVPGQGSTFICMLPCILSM